MALYKNVLHHNSNRLPKWFAEAIGVFVSLLNDCDYCVEHHFVGLKRLLKDDVRADAIRAAMCRHDIDAAPLSEAEKLTLAYVEIVTRAPAQVTSDLIEQLRKAGYDDGQILEINQVAAYFAYANRTVLGLGCAIGDEIVGLSPGESEDPNDWSHG